MALEKDLTVEGQTRRGNFLKKLEVKDKVNSKNPFGRSADQGTNNEAQNGSVMFSNGQVIVRNPQGLGKFPTISQGTKVEVLINGEKITGIAFVKEGDHIEVQVVNTEPSFSLNLKLSKDRMKASLFMRKKLGKRYEIEDIPPSLKICISAKCVQDSQIVYTYKKQVANQDSRFQSGNVLLLSVAIDEILAVKQPSVPGYPGTDVTGETVPPRQPKDEPILIKGGVRLINDETVAVATISGKPVLEGSFRKYLSVDPVYVVNGDVGINTGNISFIGNILITGSVLDGFSVDAGGSIEVWENAMHATLGVFQKLAISPYSL